MPVGEGEDQVGKPGLVDQLGRLGGRDPAQLALSFLAPIRALDLDGQRKQPDVAEHELAREPLPIDEGAQRLLADFAFDSGFLQRLARG